MLTRRQFIKTGALLLPVAGILRPSLSNAQLLFMRGPGRGISGGTFDWSSWDEVTQSGDSNTYVCRFDGGAGTNETGDGGGLAGANLVFTQFNNVPAAAGSPSTRTCNTASSHYFTFLGDGPHSLLTGSTWTLIIKCFNLGATNSLAGNDFLYNGPGSSIRIYDTNNMTSLQTVLDGTEYTFDTTPLTNTAVYLIIQRGNGNTWAGWKATKPTTKAECSTKTHTSAWSPGASAQTGYLCCTAGPANYIGAALQYIVFSNQALLVD